MLIINFSNLNYLWCSVPVFLPECLWRDPWKPKIIPQLGFLLWLTGIWYWYLYPHVDGWQGSCSVSDIRITDCRNWALQSHLIHNRLILIFQPNQWQRERPVHIFFFIIKWYVTWHYAFFNQLSKCKMPALNHLLRQYCGFLSICVSECVSVHFRGISVFVCFGVCVFNCDGSGFTTK